MNGNRRIYLGNFKYKDLPNLDDLVDLTRDLAFQLNFSPLAFEFQHYPGDGLTFVRFLAESHICIDIYPEHNIIELMLVSCKDFDSSKLLAVMDAYGFKYSNSNELHKTEDNTWQLC